MHLAELISLRPVPAAGLLLALTARCPLSCAHCSTESTSDGAWYSGEPFRRLVATFTPADRPELIFMSGGEPLLRPGLVAELATRARAAGTRSALLSGMFFAGRPMPSPIRRAIATLDHFSASIDAYHEREVSRAETFAALGAFLDLVPAVSLHVASSDPAYLADLVPAIRRAFGDRVPALVTPVQPTGRARSFTSAPVTLASETPFDPGPCEFAGWPLVDYDGTVYACYRQELGRRHRPAHLVLGHADREPWPELRARTERRPVLRSVRAFGALETARQAGGSPGASVCGTCVGLPSTVTVPDGAERVALRLLGRLGPRQLARRWGAGDYADLVELGWSPCAG